MIAIAMRIAITSNTLLATINAANGAGHRPQSDGHDHPSGPAGRLGLKPRWSQQPLPSQFWIDDLAPSRDSSVT